MTHDEIENMKKRIFDGLDMIAEKAEKIGRAKSEWSLCEVAMMANIEKDIAKSFKSLIKVHVMLNETPVEKY